MDKNTSIQVTRESKKKWEELKNHPHETFEDMINRIIRMLQEDDSKLLTKKDIKDMEKSMKEIKQGKYVTNQSLIKQFKL